MSGKKKLSGEDKFNDYYGTIYGERWEDLKQSFLKEKEPVSLSDKLSKAYYMDTASILAASCLPVKEGDKVLDMCAAPGGKTLILAMKLNGTGTLVSNDRSPSRRARLATVIKECLPPKLNSNIRITGHDSTTWSLYEKDEYDCILLDAPCSSERHVLTDPQALSIWGTGRPKSLAIRQFAMLCAALDAVKTDGFILYSTCSINPGENTGVIEKLLTKRKGRVEVRKPNLNATALSGVLTIEDLSYGSIVLPDKSDGAGPLYFCLLRRIS